MARQPIKVNGLDQIPKDAEIANAKLILKPSGIHFHITTYTAPVDKEETGQKTGIDFGIKNTLTYSNGDKLDTKVPETKRVKLAARRMNKAYTKTKDKGTGNHKRRVQNVRTAYEKRDNKKDDISNKIVHDLLKANDHVGFQDEMLKRWHSGWFGKQVQHSCMGRIKAKLKNSSYAHMVKQSFPSTQRCPVCGKDTKHTLKQRDYTCAHCGYYHPDRDVKSANVILIASLDPNNLADKKVNTS
jgi:putative transposase